MTIQTPGTRSSTPMRGVAVPLPTRREGPAKLTGQALYADDLVFPGAWYGATIRSTVPHARLLAIELDPAFDWSRVTVVTADDVPGRNIVAGIAEDQPILVPVGGVIRHQAEPVALLAAADRDTLREARRRVTLRTGSLPPVFEPLESTTVFAHHELVKGDVDAAFEEDGLEIIEATYRVGHQEQLYIENNAIIAVPREDGGMTVHGSLQCPFYVHRALRAGLDLDDAHTQVVQAETGGGFGGKEEYPSMIALHAALLARKTARPVRMIYDRHEDLSATTKRHPAVIRYRTGIRRDGTITAQDIDLVMDGGAYTTLTPVVLSRGDDPCGWPIRRRERPDPVSCRGDQHAAQRRVPRVRGAAGRVRGRDAGLPGRRGDRDVAAGGPAPQRLPARRRDADQPAAARRRGGDRGPRPRRGGQRVRARAGEDGGRSGVSRARREDRARHRARAGLARRGVHGLGRGEDGLDREPRADARRSDPDPDRVDRDGTGNQDDLPAARGRGARHRRGRRRDGAPGHRVRARLRADGGLAHGDGRRRAAHRGGATAQGGGRGRTGRPFGLSWRDDARDARGRPRIDQRVHALRRARPSTTRRTAATPTRPSAGRPRSPRSRWTWTRPRSRSCRWSPSTTSGA